MDNFIQSITSKYNESKDNKAIKKLVNQTISAKYSQIKKLRFYTLFSLIFITILFGQPILLLFVIPISYAFKSWKDKVYFNAKLEITEKYKQQQNPNYSSSNDAWWE